MEKYRTQHQSLITNFYDTLDDFHNQIQSLEEGKGGYDFEEYVKVLIQVKGILTFYKTLPVEIQGIVRLKAMRLIKEDLAKYRS